ncbi:glutaredoxin-like protein NrdH [Alloiococcus otitis]|uniref:glutaredoxin-like protein NrdH n=1 Tax=Alloiococcus otitis TaxID=1652 RepID=UPI002356D6C7|nr:glutaredoxin-like protein NrdH [Alloiococcus otitis]
MKKIVVYSKPNCMQCQFTKKFLEDRGIPYESKDVQSSDQALNEVKDMGYTSLPVVLADGLGSFNGFRPDMLSKLA